MLLLEGGSVAVDTASGVRWLNSAASAGDMDAQLALADLYREGRHVGGDSQRAAQMYRALAERNSYAAWRLGQMLESGDGVPYNIGEALRLYRRAAESGFGGAQNSLGNLYLIGAGVVQDYASARAWYEKAAASGYADALLNLAGIYYQGLGVERDYTRALRLVWEAKSSRARDASAFLHEIQRTVAETEPAK